MKITSIKIFFVSIAFILLSCNNKERWKNYPLADSTYYKDSVRKLNDSLKLVSQLEYRKSLSPTEKFTFSDSGNIFAQPDSTSLVIEKVPRFTKLMIYGDPVYKNNDEWYYVKDNGNNWGFIKSEEIALYSLENKRLGYSLIFGIKKNSHFEAEGTAVLYRVNLKDNKILESLDLPLMSTRYVKEISSSTLKSIQNDYSENTILVYTTSLEACPGTTIDCFIIDTGTKLQKLAEGISEGEESWSNSAVVYIPLKFGNGKIMLVANGDTENIFDSQTASLRVFPYPNDINVPIENLIVIDYEEGEYELDKGENLIKNEDGTYKMSLIKKSTEFYDWDGKTLKKIIK